MHVRLPEQHEGAVKNWLPVVKFCLAPDKKAYWSLLVAMV